MRFQKKEEVDILTYIKLKLVLENMTSLPLQ